MSDGDVEFHARGRVATYRAYRLDKAGRVLEAARVFEAPDDVTAMVRAHALMGDRDQVEIWEGSRQVGPTLAAGDIIERR
jgi:hypothetical protein